MKKELNIELTEVFTVKAGKTGWDKCFHGTIRRTTDADGNPVVFGKVKVNDVVIHASARDQWELGEKMDEQALMVLNAPNLYQKQGNGISLN